MNAKTLLTLAVLCILLALGYWLVPSRRPKPAAEGAGTYRTGAQVFPGFKSDDARAIAIRKGDRGIRLEKSGDKWLLASQQNRAASADSVKSLLDAFGKASVEEERVGAPAKFDLDEARRTDIEVLGAENKSLVKVLAGKSPQWGRCFIQLPGRGEILEVSENFEDRAQVTTEKDARVLSIEKWYDLKLLRFASDDVIDVAITKGDATWRIQKVVPGKGPVEPGKKVEPPKKEEPKTGEKKDAEKKEAEKKEAEKKEEPKPAWRITAPADAEADDSACSGICSTAAYLDAKGYADDVKPEERGLDKPTSKTKLVLKDGTAHALTFGKVADDYVVMQIEGRPDVWKIEKYSFESLTKPLDKLKKEVKPEEKKAEEKKVEPEKAEGKKAEAPPAAPAKKDDAAKKEEPAIPPIPEKVKEEPKQP